MKLFIVIICLYVLFKMQAVLYKSIWNKNLYVDISIKDLVCNAGDKNVLTEVITNDKALPLPMVHVKFNTPRTFVFDDEKNSCVTDYYYRDDIFSIKGHEEIKRELTFTCTKRGCFYMNDISITTTDLLMSEQLLAKMKNKMVIHVYPRKLSMRPFEIPYKTIMGDFIMAKHVIDDPFEFRGIREYLPTDTMRSINWKCSAKHNKLQVNTFFTTSSQEVVILLNLESEIYSRDEKLQEAGISIASTIASQFVKQKIPVAIETNGKDLFTNERVCRKAGSYDKHMDAIDHALSRIDLSLKYDDFLEMIKGYFDNRLSTGQMSGNAVYVFISNYRHGDLMDYYAHLKSSGLSCYFIVPETKIVNLDDISQDVIKWEVE